MAADLITNVISLCFFIFISSAVEGAPGSRILENKLKFLTDQPFNEFDWKLSKVLDKNEHSNFVVSPLSVKFAMAMLYLGVQGSAAREIEEALKINSAIKETVEQKLSTLMKSIESKEEEYELNIGTKLFHDKSSTSVNTEFAKKLRDLYNSSISPVEFKQKSAAIAEINSWCSKITNGKIKELISEGDIGEEVALLLLNAIYFRGEWEKPFSQNLTKLDNFYLSNQQLVPVQMMTIDEKFFYYNMQELKSQLFRLPYAGNKFAMYIIMPNEIDGLANLVKDITPEILAKSLKLMAETQARIRFPKFKFESTATLVPILKQLNIKELFSDSANLEYIGKSNKGPLTISSIIQKSGIEVNERGSSAYAATEVVIDSRFGSDGGININVNHPFVFLIADESKDTIVFTGKVVDPSTFILPTPVSNLLPVEAGIPDYLNRIKPNQQEELNSAYNYFDKEILLKAVELNPASNIVISPASIKSAIGLLLEGASGNTEKELIKALRLPREKIAATIALQAQLGSLNPSQSQDSVFELENQNKIFLSQDEKLASKYAEVVRRQYNTDIEKVNFAKADETSNKINDWINQISKGLIPNLVNKDDFDSATKLFLINCIYFKSNWLNEFDSKLTRVDCFKTPGGCQKVNFMTGEFSLNYYDDNDLGFKMVEIPFKNEQYSMVIILPHESDGITKLLKDLQHQNILGLFASMKKYPIQLTIPRTTIEFFTSLSGPFEKMDIKELFTPMANITNILEQNRPITVKDVIHKAKIEINEQGAKAAAASGVQVVLLSASMALEFKADHPFVFFIRDVTKPGFLFEGVLITPDKAADSLKSTNTPIRNNIKTTTPQVSLVRASVPPAMGAAQVPAKTSPSNPSEKKTTPKRNNVEYQQPRPIETGSVEFAINKSKT